METNPLLKLIELDEKLTILEEEGEEMREPFNAMMKRQQERYSSYLSTENDPAVDPESVKNKINGMKELMEVTSMDLSNWDYSNEKKKEYYQNNKISEMLVLKNNPAASFDLGQPDTIEEIITTLEQLLLIQIKIISSIWSTVGAEERIREYMDSIELNLN